MSERVAMTLRIPREDHEQLRRISFERRMPINELVRRAVHALLSSEEEQAFLLGEDGSTGHGAPGCDVCGAPHVMVSTPGGFRFCEAHRPDSWVTAPDGEEFRVGECQGHAECPVERHEHGCFADDGSNCDHPEEHPEPGDPS